MKDNELNALMEPYLTFLSKSVIPCKSVQTIKSVPLLEQKPKENEPEKIHYENLLLPYTCYLHPDSTITELYEIADLPLSTGNKRKVQAINDGLITEFSFVIKSGRGGSAKFLALTPKGYEVLNLAPKISARGGIEHNFGIFLIKKHFYKKGYKIEIEKHIKKLNGFVDVVAEKDKEKIAIEVCIQKQNIITTIEKLNNDCFTRKILCFETEKQANSQKQILSKQLQNSAIEEIEFLPLHQFYKH